MDRQDIGNFHNSGKHPGQRTGRDREMGVDHIGLEAAD
jgi:hypothetical protein